MPTPQILKLTESARPPFLFFLSAGLLLVSGPLSAQTAPQPTQAVAALEEKPIELSPFVVTTEKDKGYKATNSISGTRLNTPIKDLPLNLEVITNQFMQDTGATNLREALRYSAGMVLDSQSDAFTEMDGDPQGAGANDPRGATRRSGESTTKVRGFVTDQVLRDGFRRQFSADSVNIDRVEVLRGPSALLYGVGSLGGVINYMPKRPLLTPKYSTTLTVGSYDLHRVEIDFTGPLGHGPMKAAYRLTGAWQERGNETEYYHRKTFTLSPSFSFRPFKNTEVLFDNEFGSLSENGVGSQNIRSGLNSAASRTANWLTDSSNGVIDTRTFRWTGPDTYLKGPFRNHIIDITQKIGDDLFVRVGVGRSVATFDSRQITDTSVITSQPFTTTNPLFYYPGSKVTIGGTSYDMITALTTANSSGTFQGLTPAQIAALRTKGTAWADVLYGFVATEPVQNQVIPGAPQTSPVGVIRYRWRDYNREEVRDQVRADAAYELDLGKLGKHNFIAGLQYMGLESNEAEYSVPYSYVGKTVADTARYSYKNPTDYTPFRYGMRADGVPDVPSVHLYDYVKKTWDFGYFAVYQGRFWSDRITLIGGMRHDRNDAIQTQNYIYEAGRAPTVSSRATFSDKAPTANSPQVGVSVKLNRSISVFGVYSTGVIPNYSAYDGNGKLFDPTKAKSVDVGVKFDALNGKISGTISKFKITRENTPRFLWWAPSPYASKLKGYDSTKPSTTVWWEMGPESLYYAMKTAGGAAAAKKIFPVGFHSTLDAIAALPGQAANPNKVDGTALTALLGPGSAKWWSFDVLDPVTGAHGLIRDARTNSEQSNFSTGVYSPLVNMGDPAVAAFVQAAKLQSGSWGGNFYYTTGQTYRFGDGASGIGNAADGSGASVALNDESSGWDGQVVLSPTPNLQVVMNYSHLQRKVTSQSYSFVKAPYWILAPWYVVDGNYGTLSYTRTVAQAYTDPTDTSTYHAPIPDYGQRVDDSPENAGSVWVRYSLARFQALKGVTFGVGGQWEDKRLWFTGFTGGGGNAAYITDSTGERVLVNLYTKDRYTFNGFVEYKTKFGKRTNARFALNVDNILDDQGRYGLVYASGASYRLSARFDF